MAASAEGSAVHSGAAGALAEVVPVEVGKTCPSCGTAIKRDAGFCPNCGAKLDSIRAGSGSDRIQRGTSMNFTKVVGVVLVAVLGGVVVIGACLYSGYNRADRKSVV